MTEHERNTECVWCERLALFVLAIAILTTLVLAGMNLANAQDQGESSNDASPPRVEERERFEQGARTSPDTLRYFTEPGPAPRGAPPWCEMVPQECPFPVLRGA